jgi:hypothetical protein
MLDFDLTDPHIVRDPYPLFEALRQQAPVVWSNALDGWMAVSYDAVKQAARGSEFSVDTLSPFFATRTGDVTIQELATYVRHWLIFTDPPKHTRMRAVMNRGFAASRIAGMEALVRKYVQRLLDAIGDRDEIDLIADFAFALPAMVIAGMIGVPDAVIPHVQGWSDDLGEFIASAPGSEKYQKAQAGGRAMADCFRELIAERRRQPTDDLLSGLVQARDQGYFASDEELISNCILLLFAGHETTTNLITNGMYHLLQNPAQYALLRDNPDVSVTAVEEMLRYENPVNGLTRLVLRDTELAGHPLREGERVFAFIPAANRDPAKFAEPNRMDITRKPNPHLSFGSGIHLCLGAPLARLEARVVFDMLPKWLHAPELVTTEPEWKALLVLRGMKALRIRFTPLSQREQRRAAG